MFTEGSLPVADRCGCTLLRLWRDHNTAYGLIRKSGRKLILSAIQQASVVPNAFDNRPAQAHSLKEAHNDCWYSPNGPSELHYVPSV